MRKLFLFVILCCLCNNSFAQQTISGIVHESKNPDAVLPGVSVQVVGKARGTITDTNGRYSIRVQPGENELVFCFIGMKCKTVAIGNKTQINIAMEDADDVFLNEVVVSALGIKRQEKSLTTAQQQVDAGTISEVRDANLVSSLAGKVAGMTVTPPTSSTGSARIVIRGNSSINGNNQPLFVVDGMPIDNSDGSSGVNKNGGLDMGNGVADINPDDIESIDVLKGPNAAALYGSQAANGVILITTKKAKEGRFKVSLSSNTMMHYISQWPDFENAFGVGHMTQSGIGGSQSIVFAHQDANGNLYPYPGIPTMIGILNNVANRSNGAPQVGWPYIGLDGLIHPYSPQPDNVYGFYQQAWAYTNNIAIEGGNADNNYRFSFTNYNANDVVEKQNLVNRNTLTLRFINTLLKNLTLDSKVTLTDDNTDNRRYANQSNYNPLYMYTIMPRTLTLDQLKDYKTINGTEAVEVGDIHNPYWTINETSNSDDRTRLLANFDLSYQILPTLRANIKYAREYSQTKSDEFRNMGAIGGDDNNGKGYYSTSSNMFDNQRMEWLLLYNQRFEHFSLVGTLGGSRMDYMGQWQSSEITELKVPGLQSMENYESKDFVNATNGLPSTKRINSLYGSISAGYRDFAYLDITGRNDWSSTLPPENCSYFYPSIGFSIIPTEMLKVPTKIMYGKLRASYAEVGNDTNPYNLIPYYELNYNAASGTTGASLPGTLPKIDLKPERTQSYEFGGDFRFLNGRINADITYYKKNSFDQILSASMAASSGYQNKVFNSGEIDNNGWEVMLNLKPVVTKKFSWDIDVNYSHNESMVKSLEGESQIQIGEIFSMQESVVSGLPYGAMFGTVWLTDKQGRRMVNMTNGEPVAKPNSYLGNFNPDFMLSVNNRFRWGSFDLYVLLDMKKGGKLYSGTRRQAVRNGVISGLETADESYWKRNVIFGDNGNQEWGGVQFNNKGTTPITNQNIYYYDPTKYDNINNMNPIDPNYKPTQSTLYFWPGNVGYYADGFDNLDIYDASFIKLREISVGYNLPKKLISKIKMSNARISFVGRNLWIFYQNTPKGLDPEAALNAGNGQGLESGSLPPSTTFGVDLKLAF